MNRKQRREAVKQGKPVQEEPTINIKPSELVNAALKGPGKKAMDHEIRQQLLKMDEEFCKDVDIMVLWTLYSCYGWGAKRLKEFYTNMLYEHRRMREYYEMDELYPERQKIKEKLGVDIDEWRSELFDKNGNLKAKGNTEEGV